LAILNIGLDRELLSRETRTEAQERQLFYCRQIPARIVHLVKAAPACSPEPFDLDPALCIVPCRVRHWAGFVPAAIRRGAALLRAEHFDLIQVQEPYLSGLVGAWLSRLYGVPLVVGLYSDEVDNPVWLAGRLLNRMANQVAKAVLRRAAGTRTDSRAVALRVAGGSYRLVTYIPFLITHAERLVATDAASSMLRARLLDGRPGPLLLAVSRLEAEKNLPLMLRAVAAAAEMKPGLVLAVAGSGRLAEFLAKQAESLAPGRVRWLGWVASDTLAAYYQAADLMLISSDPESAARVLTESLLAGTPVLSTDTAGAHEVVEDGVSGRIVPVGDTAAYAEALIEMISDPVRLARMGMTGRERMRASVTAEAVVTKMRDFYRNVLGALDR
jgi:glycosyltransferase involved in cell wall biosynthesis